MIQYSLAHRTADLADLISRLGSTAFFLSYTGAPPASCAAAATGVQIASIAMANPPGPPAGGGVQTFTGPLLGTALVAGTHGTFRLCTDSTGATCVMQGTIFNQVGLVTNAACAPLGNVLSFAAVNQVQVGMNVAGAGIPAGCTVVNVDSVNSLVYLSGTSVPGVPSGTAISFGGDLNMNSASVYQGQTIQVSALTLTAGGA